MYSLRGPTGSAPPRLAPIWRANRLDAKPGVAGHPTGFPTLDAELPDRGWPRAGLVEILSPNDASAAWSLLAPWLCRPAVDAGPILCLSPPHEPYAPALQQLGIPLERLFLVRAETAADTAWAAEQALQVIACTAILLWVSTNIQEPNPVMLRRIHLASVAHPTPVFVFGPIAVVLLDRIRTLLPVAKAQLYAIGFTIVGSANSLDGNESRKNLIGVFLDARTQSSAGEPSRAP